MRFFYDFLLADLAFRLRSVQQKWRDHELWGPGAHFWSPWSWVNPLRCLNSRSSFRSTEQH
jgi:hypothetical protein